MEYTIKMVDFYENHYTATNIDICGRAMDSVSFVLFMVFKLYYKYFALWKLSNFCCHEVAS